MSTAGQLLNRAVGLQQAGRLLEALRLVDLALAHEPINAEGHYIRGAILWASKRNEEALRSTDRAISLHPRLVGALYNRAIMLRHFCQYDRALSDLGAAITIDPNYSDALLNMVDLLHSLGRIDEALTILSRAPAVEHSANLLSLQGSIFQKLEQFDGAIDSFNKAIALAPNDENLFFNRGNTLSAQRSFSAALDDYKKAIVLNPLFGRAYNNRGAAFKALHLFSEALACFQSALVLEKNSIEAMVNCAGVLQELHRHDEAIQFFAKILEICPDRSDAIGGWISSALHLCDWSSLDHLRHVLTERLAKGDAAISPFVFLAICDDPALQHRCSTNYIDLLPKRQSVACPSQNHIRINLVYISPDFAEHPVAHLIVELIERHNRDMFTVTGISLGRPDDSSVRKRLVGAFDGFYEASAKSDGHVAALIRSLEADILIDLAGHTRNARPGIFCYRPAPTQVSYLGFAGTTGLKTMDYIIGDPIALPNEHRRFFSERIVQLPHCYLPPSSNRVSPNRLRRCDVGLREDEFVFCCFNSPWKIVPELFDVWMRILASIENSILWIGRADELVRLNLRKEATKRGIAAERLVFAQELPLEQHLARLALADLFLDTLPFNGHTTIFQTLSAGLPVLTCMGQTFASRVGASLINAAGLSELIAADLVQYQTLAETLAREPLKLEEIRRRLLRGYSTQSLFEVDRYCADIERAYLQMIEEKRKGDGGKTFADAD